MSTKLTVNNQQYTVDAAQGTPLLWVLREHLQLTGTMYRCGIAPTGCGPAFQPCYIVLEIGWVSP